MKRRFIRCTSTVRSWIVPQWLSADWRARGISYSVQEPGCLKQEGPMVQLQSETEGLETPWRIAGKNLLWKSGGAGV